MIESVEFRSSGENPYRVELVQPDPMKFLLVDIDGVGAGKADLHISTRSSLDGDTFNGGRVGSRNLVFTFEYGDRLDPELGRELSHTIFPLTEKVTMIFRTTSKTVMIEGVVESNEPEVFTSEPSFKVSIMCIEQPYFKTLPENASTFQLFRMSPQFEFPFSNESLTEPLNVLGEHNVDTHADLAYDGTRRTGVNIRMIFTGPVTNPSITADRDRRSMRIDTTKLQKLTGAPIQPGDVIDIDTVRGRRSITLLRDGLARNVLDALDRLSKWIEVSRGVNPISVNADSGIANLQVEIKYDSYYSGL